MSRGAIYFNAGGTRLQGGLNIIDLSKRQQPLFNENQNLCLVCNGRIYNYLQLRQELIDKGHHFRSESDSEVILHLYEEEGERCVDRLRGACLHSVFTIAKKNSFWSPGSFWQQTAVLCGDGGSLCDSLRSQSTAGLARLPPGGSE